MNSLLYNEPKLLLDVITIYSKDDGEFSGFTISNDPTGSYDLAIDNEKVKAKKHWKSLGVPNRSRLFTRNDVKLTNEAMFSVSKPVHANLISLIIRRENPNAKTITDGTANVGGNVISFCNFFDKVNAVEMNTENYNALVHNVKVYKFNNCNTVLGDYTKIYNTLEEDVIFFDPPWGGVNYKKERFLDLRIGEYRVIDFIVKLLKKNIPVYVKLPFNFDPKGIRAFKNVCIRRIANYVLLSARKN